MALASLIIQEKALRAQLENIYDQFNQLTVETRNLLEQKAVKDFTEYFTNKGFVIKGEKVKIIASVGEISITLNLNGDYLFAIQIRKQKEMTAAYLFSILSTEEIDVSHRQVWAKEIREDSSAEFVQQQIANLEHNKSGMEKVLTHISDEKFVYKLDKCYFGDDTEFDNIEQILELVSTQVS